VTKRKDPKRKKKTGRKSAYKPAYNAIAGAMTALGATDREVAQALQVSEQTLNTWKHKHPAFLESLKLGKESSDKRVEVSLYRRANGYSFDAEKVIVVEGKIKHVPYVEHVPPDTTACIFWLKNRKPLDWRDRKAVALENLDGKPFETQSLPAAPETIGKYYERLAQIAADRAAPRPARPVGGAGVSADREGPGDSEG
jgi:hypothetical protein